MATQCIKRIHFFAIIATLLFLSFAFSQRPDVKFEHLGLDQGLSSESVFGIFQDSRGFMWFGTADGLNKYDGYAFTVYKYDPFDSNSIHGNNVVQIDEDSRGMLWFPGGYGLKGYDRATGKFTFFGWPGTDLVGPYPPDIHEDMSGTLWTALGQKG